MAGFIGLPISIALYYLVLRSKREDPFPKRGWVRLVSGQKKYRVLSFAVPVLYHAITNGLMASMELSKINLVIGVAASISHIVAGIVTVIVILRWQKNKTLDVSVLERPVPNEI